MRRIIASASLAIAGLGLWVSPVRAQRAPDLATLDRGDGISRVGLDTGLTLLDVPGYDAALRLEPFGQYVTRSGFGFYGALPIALSFGDGDADTAALGNVDVGALYVIDAPTVSWVFRGGVALPTADDDLPGFLANFYATWPRLTDLALTIPDAVYVRLAFSPLIHVDNFYLRADIGFDLAARDGDVAEADSMVRLNIGGGFDLGPIALGLELANLATFDDFDDGDPDDDENFLHVAAFTLRFMGEALQPFVAVGAPVDDFVRDNVNLFIAAGIQAAF